MAKKALRISVAAVMALLALLIAASAVTGVIMTDTALNPEGDWHDVERAKAKWERRMPGLIQWYDSLRLAGVFRDTVITSPDGVRLHAVYAAAPAKASGTAVLVHGYKDCHISMMQVARIYREQLNFNVLAVDNRFHGLSGGDHIQMGWLDRLDVKLWLPVSHDIFGNDFTVVHGISMGGATTMMLSGEPDLPAYVRAFVDDCGYSSVWDEFKFVLKDEYHLPMFPVLPMADLVCRLRHGWGFREASSVEQLKKSTAPVLFIHGHEDDFVPTDNVLRCYGAKTQGYKDIWVTPSTIHARSSTEHPSEYAARLKEFFSKVHTL